MDLGVLVQIVAESDPTRQVFLHHWKCRDSSHRPQRVTATEKRCIATLDVGGRSWHPANRASLEAAARRCDAGLVIFTEPLAKCHIWWQKTFAVDCLLQNDHVLQIDADGLIAEDGPSPFPECEPGRLGVCRDLQHPCQYRLARWLSSTTRRWSRYLGLGQPGGR